MRAADMSPADPSALAALVDAFSAARVACVGDAMLDRYVYGTVERVSPEAPIPVLRIAEETTTLGGAGNVARNLAALGTSVALVAVLGDDQAAHDIERLLAELKIEAKLVRDKERPTTIKTRYVAAGQQLLRADRESDAALTTASGSRILERAESAIANAAVVVLSDYGKGMVTDAGCARLIAAARAAGKPVIVDPKGPNFAKYRGASVVTPNRRELAEAIRMPVGTLAEVEAAAERARAESEIEAVLVTLSADGMLLVDAAGTQHLPAEAREVFDVSGAGDTVAATLAAALAVGASLVDAARLANVAAGIVVAKRGTAVTLASELIEALHTGDLMTGERKLVPLSVALERIATWRARGEQIGFTNGVFDLIHPGHVSLLAQARAASGRLVVGLNADASVKRLKGPERPIQSEAARAAVLGSLASVDLVIMFGEDTPIRLIEAIRPDVLVKGADYALNEVVGADIVRSYGGKVLLAELAPGHSTTATIRRIAG